MSEPVEVHVRTGDCPCPGQPHTEEIVYLAARITNPMGIAAYAALNEATNSQDMQAALGAVWLRYGIVSWTFLEPNTHPDPKVVAMVPARMVPITPASIDELLPWSNGGFTVANKADDLYSDEFFRPLAKKPTESSSATQTEPSTSPTPLSGPSHRRRSRRSSPNGTAGRPSAVRAS